MTDRTPPLDYEAVKDFFYNKLSQDRQGRGRMESAIFHTVQHVYLLGCHRADEVAAENARLTERIRALEAALSGANETISMLREQRDLAGCSSVVYAGCDPAFMAALERGDHLKPFDDDLLSAAPKS